MTVIQCENLTKRYGKFHALHDVSLTIEGKKITGLIGRNGAGKTTLLKCIAGLYRKTSGELKVFGENPFNSLYVSENCIYVSDEMSFPTTLTLEQLLDMASIFYKNWDAQLAKRLFDYFSLNPNQYHHRLSKGMTSTFNMIVGLASRCELTLFDEPTTGMDEAVRQDFYRAVLKDYLQNPRTMIISSHHLNEIEHLLEDVLLLKEGKPLLHIPMSELKEYAIGVQGDSSLIAEWCRDREVIFTKEIGTDKRYAVVKNHATKSDIQRAKMEGLQVLPVSPSDLCVYLTNKRQGGIDDVFRQDELV